MAIQDYILISQMAILTITLIIFIRQYSKMYEQTRLLHNSNQMSIYQSMLDNFQRITMKGMNDEAYLPVFGYYKGYLKRDYDEVKARQVMYVQMTLVYLEMIFLLKKKNMLDLDIWKGWDVFTCETINNPIFLEVWNELKGRELYHKDFKTYLAHCIARREEVLPTITRGEEYKPKHDATNPSENPR